MLGTNHSAELSAICYALALTIERVKYDDWVSTKSIYVFQTTSDSSWAIQATIGGHGEVVKKHNL